MSKYIMDEILQELVGTTIQKIYMNSDKLIFVTDKGDSTYSVYGECCSKSYFYDFHGVKKLLCGNPVVSTKVIDLISPHDEDAEKGDIVTAYGYEIVTADPIFGDVTSVFSFRNDSNGYYGGWIIKNKDNSHKKLKNIHRITNDILEIPS